MQVVLDFFLVLFINWLNNKKNKNKKIIITTCKRDYFIFTYYFATSTPYVNEMVSFHHHEIYVCPSPKERPRPLSYFPKAQSIHNVL